jgi:hypothetical protein
LRVSYPDGLYRVENSYLCAGFVIDGGEVTHCAPILRRRLAYWVTQAKPVQPDAPQSRLQPRTAPLAIQVTSDAY